MNEYFKMIEKHFSYLDELGYKIEDNGEQYIVKFVNESCTIEFMFDTVGYELTCQFINRLGESFSLQEALDYMGLGERMGIYQIGDKSDLEIGVIYLASTVKMILFQVNISTADMFRYICKQQVVAKQEKLRQYYLEYDLKRAEQFWKQKEYGNAKILFEKHLDSLSELEKKKLEYIKRHI